MAQRTIANDCHKRRPGDGRRAIDVTSACCVCVSAFAGIAVTLLCVDVVGDVARPCRTNIECGECVLLAFRCFIAHSRLTRCCVCSLRAIIMRLLDGIDGSRWYVRAEVVLCGAWRLQ
jgi:hypothetical protein